MFALSTVGLAFTLYLAWASYVQLKTFCMLCATTYVAVIALFIISGGATTFPMTTLPRRAPRDLRTLVSSPVALVLALLYPRRRRLGHRVLPERRRPGAGRRGSADDAADRTAARRVDKWWDLQPKVDLPVPAEGAKVMVVRFSDFQCPHCRSRTRVLQETHRQVRRQQPGAVRAQALPARGECNPYAPNGNHMAACEAAAAVVHGAGDRQGRSRWRTGSTTTRPR